MPAQRNPRVLVVDDDLDVLLTVAEALLEVGYVVQTAADGESALRIAGALRPDVAIVDIDLPVMDGYELARCLRALPLVHGLRLVAFSGYARDRARELAAQVAFDVHLMKPASLDALIEVVGCPERCVPAPND